MQLLFQRVICSSLKLKGGVGILMVGVVREIKDYDLLQSVLR